MELVLKSSVFTDEQKVQVIKAIVDKKITLSFTPSFTVNKDYYFIKNNAVFEYMMTFKDGFKCIKFNHIKEDLANAFVENNYPIEQGITSFSNYANYTIAYNPNQFYPFLYCDNKETFYAKEGKSVTSLLHIIRWFNIGPNTLEFIKFISKSDVVLKEQSISSIDKDDQYFIITYMDKTVAKFQHTEIKKQEKDTYMMQVDQLPNSQDAKIKYESVGINHEKARILSLIRPAISDGHNSVTINKSKYCAHPQITEYINYICTTKNYEYTDLNESQFIIKFY